MGNSVVLSHDMDTKEWDSVFLFENCSSLIKTKRPLFFIFNKILSPIIFDPQSKKKIYRFVSNLKLKVFFSPHSLYQYHVLSSP